MQRESFSLETLADLRSRLLNRILWIAIPLAGISVAAGSMLEFRTSANAATVIPIYCALYAVVAAAALWVRLGFKIRGTIFLASLYAVALSRLWFVGMSAMVTLFLFGFMVFAGILFGRRAGLYAFGLAVASLAGDAMLVRLGVIEYGPPYQELALNPIFWLAQTLPLAFISAGAVMSITMLLQRLDEQMQLGNRLTTQLQAEISDRQRTETSLRESEESFRLIFEHAPDVCFLRDDKGLLVDGNRTAERVIGYSREELVGKNFLDLQLVHPDELQRARDSMALIAQGVDIGPQVYNIRQKAGTYVPLEIQSHPFNLQGIQRVLSIARDISVRRREEQALLESEARYRSLVEQPHDMILRADLKGRITYVNVATAVMLGFTPEELIGRPGDCVVTEASARQMYSNLSRRLKGELGITPHVQEIVLRRKDGTEFPGELRTAPIIDAEGQIVEMQGVIRDISERKQSEILESIQRSLLENLAAGLALDEIMNAVTRHIDALNPGMLSSILLLDQSRQHLVLGASPNLPASYNEAINGIAIGPGVGSCGNTAYTGERTIVDDVLTHPNWEPYRDLAIQAGFRACWSEPILSTTREVLGTFALYMPVPGPPTEERIRLIETTAHFISIAIMRKRAEEALQNSEALYHSLVENLPQHIFRKDLEGRFTFANGRFCNSLRRTHDEIIGFTDADLYPPNLAEKYQADDRKVIETGVPLATIEEHCDLEHGTRVVEVVKTPLTDTHGQVTGVQGIFWDITERQRAEEQRRELEHQMQHVQKLESLGVLAGGIAHDFNNLLMVILGHASLVLSELPPSSPVRDSLSEIENASRRAAELCRQMLAYSGKGMFVLETVDLGDLVTEIVHLLKASISKKALLRLELSQGLPPVEVDATQIRQVLMNLITNASEAIGERSGVITVSTGATELGARDLQERKLGNDLQEGLYLYLEVTDTGCGMDPETRERIFDPFFTTKFTGRGLGMAAVLGIVRGHKGAIQIQSEPGKGSTFRVLLPAQGCAGTPEAKTGATDAGAWRSSGMVLIVDDEETLRMLGKKMLASLGFTVLTANDGADAVRIYREHRDAILFVLLDLTMPRMDGEETLRELQRLDPKVRVILTSGYTEHEIADRFAGQGLAGFVQKPYSIEALKNTIRMVSGGG